MLEYVDTGREAREELAEEARERRREERPDSDI